MIEIAGLTATGEDDAGRTYYKQVKGRITQQSQYNDQQYQIKGLEGYWESATALQIGRVYEMALTAKAKTGANAKPGSKYLDIRSATLDESIPAEAPQQATSNGGQGRPVRPDGDFNTGMAFNQACTITAAMIIATTENNGSTWPTDTIIDNVTILRERLYHGVLMQPIGAPDETPSTGWEEEPETLADEESPPSDPF